MTTYERLDRTKTIEEEEGHEISVGEERKEDVSEVYNSFEGETPEVFDQTDSDEVYSSVYSSEVRSSVSRRDISNKDLYLKLKGLGPTGIKCLKILQEESKYDGNLINEIIESNSEPRSLRSGERLQIPSNWKQNDIFQTPSPDMLKVSNLVVYTRILEWGDSFGLNILYKRLEILLKYKKTHSTNPDIRDIPLLQKMVYEAREEEERKRVEEMEGAVEISVEGKEEQPLQSDMEENKQEESSQGCCFQASKSTDDIYYASLPFTILCLAVFGGPICAAFLYYYTFKAKGLDVNGLTGDPAIDVFYIMFFLLTFAMFVPLWFTQGKTFSYPELFSCFDNKPNREIKIRNNPTYKEVFVRPPKAIGFSEMKPFFEWRKWNRCRCLKYILTMTRDNPLYDFAFWGWMIIVVCCENLRFIRLSLISVILKIVQLVVLLTLNSLTELNGIDKDLRSALVNWDFGFVSVNLIAHIAAGLILTFYYGHVGSYIEILDEIFTYITFAWVNILLFLLPASARNRKAHRGMVLIVIANSIRILILAAFDIHISTIEHAPADTTKFYFEGAEYIKVETCLEIVNEQNGYEAWMQVRLTTVSYLLAFYIKNLLFPRDILIRMRTIYREKYIDDTILTSTMLEEASRELRGTHASRESPFRTFAHATSILSSGGTRIRKIDEENESMLRRKNSITSETEMCSSETIGEAKDDNIVIHVS